MRNFAVHIDGPPGAILPVCAVPPGLSFVRMQELVWLLEQGYGGLELEYMQGLLHQLVSSSTPIISIMEQERDLPCPLKGVVAVVVADAVARHGGIPELMLDNLKICKIHERKRKRKKDKIKK